ncbi:MAG: DoxX subfamily [Rikenellaceae bacterium]|jgi:thiosulfate dehydrogenase [quinone] large subunit|nr:DoxX subfamily [Rikenellaceae bacterium]
MQTYSKIQTFWLVALRMAIGWHFLYEGIAKALSPKWTAAGYLMDSQGWFASMFRWMAGSETTLGIVDFCNEWGLVLIGLGLIAGCMARAASIGGIVLLGFYFLSHPPFIGSESMFMLPREGSYMWIDRNLIEIAALALLYVFPTSRRFGLDGYIFKKKNNV